MAGSHGLVQSLNYGQSLLIVAIIITGQEELWSM